MNYDHGKRMEVKRFHLGRLLFKCNAGCYDGRSLAGRRRRQSRRKATDVMVELIHSAQCAGITARYVLFDSWFSAPKTIIALKEQEHLDTIAMMKKSRAKYTYQGERLNVKEIYGRNRKRRGRSRYLLSVSVDVEILWAKVLIY